MVQPVSIYMNEWQQRQQEPLHTVNVNSLTYPNFSVGVRQQIVNERMLAKSIFYFVLFFFANLAILGLTL